MISYQRRNQKKDHKHAYAYAHKIKPTRFLGMNMALKKFRLGMDKIEGNVKILIILLIVLKHR
jgi:hypothetical protein